MKKCPFCAEEIQDAAIVCKHCGRDLVVSPTPTFIVAPKKKSSLLGWLVLGIFVVIGVGWCASAVPGPSSSSAPMSAEDAALLVSVFDRALAAGVIMKVESGTSHAYVDPDTWNSLSFDQKSGLARALAYHFKARGDTGFAHIYDGRTGKHIAKMTSFGAFSVD